MFYKNRQNSECKGLKWYIAEMLYPPNNVGFVRISKICGYENPYTVTGSIKQTGSQELPKDTCKDRTIGTW